MCRSTCTPRVTVTCRSASNVARAGLACSAYRAGSSMRWVTRFVVGERGQEHYHRAGQVDHGRSGWVRDTLTELTNWIINWKGPPAKDEVVLVADGPLIMPLTARPAEG